MSVVNMDQNGEKINTTTTKTKSENISANESLYGNSASWKKPRYGFGKSLAGCIMATTVSGQVWFPPVSTVDLTCSVKSNNNEGSHVHLPKVLSGSTGTYSSALTCHVKSYKVREP